MRISTRSTVSHLCRMARKSVLTSSLFRYTLKGFRNVLLGIEFRKIVRNRPSLLNSQVTTPRCYSINWLTCSNRNFSDNMGELYKLTEFWVILPLRIRARPYLVPQQVSDTSRLVFEPMQLELQFQTSLLPVDTSTSRRKVFAPVMIMRRQPCRWLYVHQIEQVRSGSTERGCSWSGGGMGTGRRWRRWRGSASVKMKARTSRKKSRASGGGGRRWCGGRELWHAGKRIE